MADHEPPTRGAPVPVISRRTAIGGLATSLVGVVACQRAPAPPAARVPLADLTDGRRVLVQVGPAPVEVRQEAGRIRARYLVCTHMACRVSPDDRTGGYRCACHDGRYDADGTPTSGPPPTPLAEAPFEVEEDAVVFRPA